MRTPHILWVLLLRRWCRWGAFVYVSLTAAVSHANTGAADAAMIGEAIYLHGVSGSGAAVEAIRGPDMSLSGAAAACVNCHQRSGFGTREGRYWIPPITGGYLFRPRGRSDDDLPYVEGIRSERVPYTDATLARAISEGVDAEGRVLDYLMPRFALNDADMAGLIAYLKRLDQHHVPGVTDTVLHFATIVTPDADPAKTKGMLSVMEQFFADKNTFPVGAIPRLKSSRKMMFMVHRRWQLHVWRLTGPSESWQRQLEKHLAAEPVLAVISGVGGTNWTPVQSFCERQSLPCLFPNLEAPPADADRNFYSVYFSKGVLVEAALIAKEILDAGIGRTGKVVRQVYRAGDSGESGAQALAVVLKSHGIKVQDQALVGGSGHGVAAAVHKADGADAIVLWLRPADLAALGGAMPIRAFVSGVMGGLEHAPLPAEWRKRALMTYPFDLPEQRRVRVDFARGWFAVRKIPVVDEQVQADTYLACGLVSETLSHMVDAFVRDYLVERLQSQLEHRIITGYYPRLSLATGQRFAAKGGYVVHFAEPVGTRLVADSGWIVP